MENHLQDKELSESTLLLPTPLTDPRHTNTRFSFLFLSCFICIGSYFIYDNPAALETHLLTTLDIDLVSFNLLYSVYSLPNIIFPLFGGILVDYIGVRSVLLTCSLLVVFGQGLFLLGVTYKTFWIALIGRGMFGCGGENLDLAQSIIVLRWFTGKELSMAFGITSMSSLMGSVINDNIEPYIAENYGLSVGIFSGMMVCVMSFLATLLAISIDGSREKIVQSESSDGFKMKYVYKFDRIFLLMMVNCICMECSVYCFSYIASGFLQDRFGYSSIEAGTIMSVSFFVSAFLSPLCGVTADKLGKRGVMLVVANGIIASFHLFCMQCEDNVGTPAIVTAFIALGIGFALHTTVFWTSLAYVVKQKVVGTAYGFAYSLSNLALVVFPVIVGLIHNSTESKKGYYWVNFFLASLASIGMLSTFIVYKLDFAGNRVLENRVPLDLDSS